MVIIKVDKECIEEYNNISIIKISYKNYIKFMKIDTEDICKILNKVVFYNNNSGYIQIKINNKNILFHRFIMNVQDDRVVDHINGDRSDNRKENLRVCTKSNNQKNRIKQSNNTSGISGVSKFKKNGKWMAYICINGIQKHLGYFNTFEEAVNERKKAEHTYNEGFNPNYDRKDIRYINGNFFNKKYLLSYFQKLNSIIYNVCDNEMQCALNDIYINIKYFKQNYFVTIRKNKEDYQYDNIIGVRNVKKAIEFHLKN